MSNIRSSLKPERVLLTGSWSHGTSLRGVSDRDYFLLLPDCPPDEPRVVLERLYGELATTVSSSTVLHVDSPAVCIVDPYTRLNIDLVPAFIQGDSRDYLIPGRSSSVWIHTNPLAHISYLDRAAESDYSVRDIIRLVKAWKVRHLPELSSLYVEMFTAQIYFSQQALPLLDQLAAVMDAIARQGLSELQDPSARDGRVISALTEPSIDTRAAIRRVSDARDLVWRVDSAERSRSTEKVEEYIRALYGPVRPPRSSNWSRPLRTRRDPIRMHLRGR